jgi:acetyl esterase/lipase
MQAVALSCCLIVGCTQLGLATLNVASGLDESARVTNIAYGPAPANRLDLYLPRAGTPTALIVFSYGGGWNSGSRADYRFVGAALAARGYVAVIPDYTLYPKARFPQFMRDAAAAVAFARSHAQEWGVDPARLVLMGHSAGAQIAVLLALDREYLEQVGGRADWIRGVVGLAGPYDFLPFTDQYLNDLFGPPAEFWRSQPINFVRPGAPPMLLMHGLGDKRVSPNNTRSLTARLQAAGDEVTSVYFPGASHADLVVPFSQLRRQPPVLPLALQFIQRVVPEPSSTGIGAKLPSGPSMVRMPERISSTHGKVRRFSSDTFTVSCSHSVCGSVLPRSSTRRLARSAMRIHGNRKSPAGSGAPCNSTRTPPHMA